MYPTTIIRDVPAGWAIEPGAGTTTAPDFDTAPRLVSGATAAPELVQLLGVWSRDLHPADAAVEPKIDGHRALFLGGDDRRLLSREGSAMPSIPGMRRSLITTPGKSSGSSSRHSRALAHRCT